MMGLGYLGSSSASSASSNLSPLAPPFTVDRSSHNKPVLNSNSLSHLNDPSYGVPFTSSWPYSHASGASARHNILADSPRTTTLPSNDSGYMIPEPVNLPGTGNWSGLNSNGKHGLEQISPHWSAAYPSSKRVTDSFSYNLSEAKPFYPPYASSLRNDDIPLVTSSEPGYDLLSASGLAHGDETSQVDYTRSLSGLEYNPQQDSVWSGKQVKKLETDDSFFSEEANLAYNNYLNQGGGYGMDSRKSKDDDDPSLFYYADNIRRANNSGSLSNANDLSKTFRAFPMFSESHPLIQSPEDLWNPYHMFDDKSSSVVIKPPVEIGNLNINDEPMKEKESFLAPNQQLSFQIGTTGSEQLKFEFKASPSFHVPEISIPNVENANSCDHHNPAEDSPCWKGAAPTSQFLPEPPMKKLQTGVDCFESCSSSGVDDTIKAKEEAPQIPSGLVKSLQSLSSLLLLHCSNDESGLKEHDVEALDHVIRNLGDCMSKEVMREHASLRVEARNDNMVQGIKKVLDENLESKEEGGSVKYKDLWLEAEAELCSLSFRARFERLKRETQTVVSDAAAINIIKEVPSSCSEKKAAAAQVEDGVMARFNILKRRQDPTAVLGKDIDPWVMERLNILKGRGELDAEEKQVRDCRKEGHFQDEEEEEEEEEEAVGSSDWEHILKDDFSWRLT
ncbi:hypothetical protein LXL04_011789 [Taraxacum kok-saghyz]